MAEDMITRAAIAIAAVDGFETKRVALANYSKHARAALLAALDPEDDDLIEQHAHALYLRRRDGTDDWFDINKLNTVDRDFWRAEARATIASLRAIAQGEQPVRSDMREKD